MRLIGGGDSESNKPVIHLLLAFLYLRLNTLNIQWQDLRPRATKHKRSEDTLNHAINAYHQLKKLLTYSAFKEAKDIIKEKPPLLETLLPEGMWDDVISEYDKPEFDNSMTSPPEYLTSLLYFVCLLKNICPDVIFNEKMMKKFKK
tara:strand:- start:14118 stop:14555 length:438 start_codon:yes stop_codon:yes gene_type:complete